MLRQASVTALLMYAAAGTAQQQEQPTIGIIATRDALISGGLQVQGEHAELLTSASITAYGHTAPIVLTRGGDVLVCSTSRFHVLHSGPESSLIFALDRGAIEIHSEAQPQDVVMTPDLRMTFATAGPLDLRLRVTSNGDTCVENTGKSAPQIAVSDAFSDSSYRLRPGQHVLFEHGSLREVVDQEQSPCGCPAEVPLSSHVAQTSGEVVEDVTTRNPFPVAVSQGLAPETKPVNPAPAIMKTDSPNETTSALTYSETAPRAKPSTPSAATPTPTPVQVAPLGPPPSPPGAHDIVHGIGRFFHRLFRGGSQSSRK